MLGGPNIPYYECKICGKVTFRPRWPSITI
jgi:hypothetical protein